jgi:hypothetical protein
MITCSIIVGSLLVLLGTVSYGLIAAFSADAPSVTALIPAFAGAPILLLGLLSMKGSFRACAMRVIFALALLGFAVPASRLLMLLARGAEINPAAFSSLVLMAILCGSLLLISVKSILARREAALQKT